MIASKGKYTWTATIGKKEYSCLFGLKNLSAYMTADEWKGFSGPIKNIICLPGCIFIQ